MQCLGYQRSSAYFAYSTYSGSCSEGGYNYRPNMNSKECLRMHWISTGHEYLLTVSPLLCHPCRELVWKASLTAFCPGVLALSRVALLFYTC